MKQKIVRVPEAIPKRKRVPNLLAKNSSQVVSVPEPKVIKDAIPFKPVLTLEEVKRVPEKKVKDKRGVSKESKDKQKEA